MRLQVTAIQHAELRNYLFDTDERVAFLFTRMNDDGDAHTVDVRLLDEQDYQWRHGHGVELADHVRPWLARTAHEHGYAVVEAHAHAWPGPYTQFSRIDIKGLRELGPHMTWRLPGRPYTALVFGPDSFDALQWKPGGLISTIEDLIVDGDHQSPTGLSLAYLDENPTGA